MDKKIIDISRIDKTAINKCNQITKYKKFEIEQYFELLNLIERKYETLFKKTHFTSLTAWYTPMVESIYLIADDKAFIADCLSELLCDYTDNFILTSDKEDKDFIINEVLNSASNNTLKGVKVYG